LREPIVRKFHKAIIRAATEKLARPLSGDEKRFVTSRGGLVALEMILDTVNALDARSVEEYLNSEGDT
jgi:hypothetical protein